MHWSQILLKSMTPFIILWFHQISLNTSIRGFLCCIHQSSISNNTSTSYWWDHCSWIYVSLKLWLSLSPRKSMPMKYWWNHSDSFVQTYHFSQPGTATGHTKECPPLSYWKILTLDFWKSEKFIQVFRYW